MFGGLSTKPPPGTPLDPFQPLRQGLKWLAPIWESGGTSIYDSLGGAPLAISGTPAWQGSSSGLTGGCLSFAASGQNATASLPPSLKLSPPVMLIIGVRPVSSATSLLFGIYPNNTGADPYASYSIKLVSLGISLIASGSGALYNNVATGVTLTANTDYLIAVTFNATTYSVYAVPISGKTLLSATGTWSNSLAQSYGATANFGIGQPPGEAAANLGSNIYFAGIYSRALLACDALSLAANPWQLFGWPRFQTPYLPLPQPKTFFVRPPRQPVRPTVIFQARSPGGNPKIAPKPPAVTPWRKPVKGGIPLGMRQSVGPGGSLPPIPLNLQAWATLVLSSDADPLAVDPTQALVVD